jgi:hypothetical protein
MPEKKHSGTFKISNFFPENQLLMEHPKLLIFPDYQPSKCSIISASDDWYYFCIKR